MTAYLQLNLNTLRIEVNAFTSHSITVFIRIEKRHRTVESQSTMSKIDAQ